MLHTDYFFKAGLCTSPHRAGTHLVNEARLEMQGMLFRTKCHYGCSRGLLLQTNASPHIGVWLTEPIFVSAWKVG